MKQFIYLLMTFILWSCLNNSVTRQTVFKNATIKDGTGMDPIENGVIIIEGNKIKEIIERAHAKKAAIRDQVKELERKGEL